MLHHRLGLLGGIWIWMRGRSVEGGEGAALGDEERLGLEPLHPDDFVLALHCPHQHLRVVDGLAVQHHLVSVLFDQL
jgi:hypothetical protein